MAKNNNLTDFLTDVADAIREKKGTTDLINPQDFSAEIASIETGGGGESGGGGASVQAKDVNFRDYDGTILYSFSKDEFLELEALPELPTHDGLICQEWNWSFSGAIAYVQKYGKLELGASYVTDDGKTRLYIYIPDKGRLAVPLYFSQTKANGVKIDWGDDSATQTMSGTGNVNVTHNYADKGCYTITLEASSDCYYSLGHGKTGYCVMGSTAEAGRVYCKMLEKVELGARINQITDYSFSFCYQLKTITIPKEITDIYGYSFQNCYSLRYCALSHNIRNIGTNAFAGCYKFTSITLPDSETTISIGTYAFAYCFSVVSVTISESVNNLAENSVAYLYSLPSIIIPDSVQSIGKQAFGYCYSLTSIRLSTSITSIKQNTFYGCNSLSYIKLPNSITSIEIYSFTKCYGLALVDCREFTSIPTLDSMSSFVGKPSVIVPDSLYDSWSVATNWVTLNFIKASEYTD